jgi:hypothetical protein
MAYATFVNARSPFPIVVPVSLLAFRSCNVAGVGIGLTFTPEEEALIAKMDAERAAYQAKLYDQTPKGIPCYDEGELPLPPELGSIIQAFARPLLRFPREYKEVLQVIGQQEWPELKAKLSTNDAEQVIVYLRSYLDAHRLEVEAKDNYMRGIGSNVNWAKVYGNMYKASNELLERL